ncbi:MAG: PEP/pyruvate-binding domain-containing protein, partial [Myxococcota bacterium]
KEGEEEGERRALKEVGRATDVYEMEQVLREVPAESIAHHAARNDFSVWLKARAMFELAAEMRPRNLQDFGDIEEVRAYLVELVARARGLEQDGTISDATAPPTASDNRFVRVGRGSIGGKGRGLAFMNSLIVRHALLSHFEELQIRIPKTVVLGTDTFDRFLENNGLTGQPEISPERFLEGRLDEEVLDDLASAFFELRGPLAVRSSSVLEDSRFRPFAGVFDTYMLPNNHPHPQVRFRQLRQAIKSVYASAYSQAAHNYILGTPHSFDEQKMAVVIQQVVGQWHDEGRRYYPLLSGVAYSRNYYPIGGQRADEGVAMVALGLGEHVVTGGANIRFSPGAPTTLPQFGDAADYLAQSQREFCAIDLSQQAVTAGRSSARQYGIDAAEVDGTLQDIGSVYVAADNTLRENFKLSGPRAVTFRNVLQWRTFPLARALSLVLELTRRAIGSEVDIEFAVDGLRDEQGKPRTPFLYIVQLRPMAVHPTELEELDLGTVEASDVLVEARLALGHGAVDGVKDLIYVSNEAFRAHPPAALAERVRDLARTLREQERPFVLVGPGRWGTSDSRLGIPVQWTDIAGVRVLVELPMAHRSVEPSQGSHFFHNVTSNYVGYLTLSKADRFDEVYLLERAANEGPVLHVALSAPLRIRMDGRLGHAAILKPDGTAPDAG